jgi:hypothetical protein
MNTAGNTVAVTDPLYHPIEASDLTDASRAAGADSCTVSKLIMELQQRPWIG